MTIEPHRKHAAGFAQSTLMIGIGLSLTTLMASTMAIDTGFYFSAQNQLQTVTDAAALAGGSHIFEGEQAAKTAATELAEANDVAGMHINPTDLQFEVGSGSFKVKAQKTVPTIMANLLCSLSGKGGQLGDDQKPADTGANTGVETDGCSYMTVYAGSKVVGAPRDTVLVLDTSSSMDDLGYGQPFKDVKTAANAFLTMVVDMEKESPDSLDKVALVKFDRTSTLVRSFTSTRDSGNFNILRNDLASMRLYSGSGWNTNYEAGLKVALDQIASKGRENSHKTIIFFTDGEPNLPEGSTTISTCINYYNNRKTSNAKTCAQNYVNYMLSKTNTQIQRAVDMGVTIHTIQISDAEGGNSLETLQMLLQNPRWEPGLVDAMANATEGAQYEASSADGKAIEAIFKEVAKIVNMKLAPYNGG